MRLKTLPLMCLFLTLATQTNFAQPKAESEPTSASEYGIDLHWNYSGSEVAQLIQIVEQEAQAAIDRAFGGLGAGFIVGGGLGFTIRLRN